MRKMSTLEIGNYLGAEVIGEATVSGVSVDSRFVRENDLFVCLIGERVDGHDFAQAAIDNGAKALLVSRELDLDVSQILVPDTLQGLFDFAKVYRSQLQIEAIAITGSNGKTSTKDMLRSVLELVGPTVATFENQNTEIGSCLTLFRMDEKTKFGIFEMGLDMPGEMQAMVDLVKPTRAIVTSLDQAHADNFNDDMKLLGQEKLSIFSDIEDKSFCFYQGDYDIYYDLCNDEVSFGFKNRNDHIISNFEIKNELNEFKVDKRMYSSNVLGKHQASNAVGAILLLRSLGISDEIINEGLRNVTLTSMRTEIRKHHNATILFDAYKSSPKSLEAALDLFENYEFSGKRYMVLADMYQLGEGTELKHELALKQALSQDVDHIYLLGEEFEKAMKKFDDGKVTHYNKIEDLKDAVTPLFNQEAFILFKGSRYYALERILKEE